MTTKRARGTGAIRQLPSGRWQAKIRDAEGVWRTAPMTYLNRKDAERWLKVAEAELVVGTFTPKPRRTSTSPTFGAYAETWLAQRRTREGKPLAPTTRNLYAGLLPLISERFGNVPLDRITPSDVRQWFAGLDVAHPSRNHDAWALMRTILTSAVEDDVIATNPCKQRYTAPDRKREPRIAEPDEIEVMVANMPERLKAALLISAWCGLRLGELCELRRKDVDLAAGVIHVSRSVARVKGGYQVVPPKTNAGKRAVAIPPHILEPIQQHLDEHVAQGKEALLFPAADGSTHMAPSSLYGSATKGFGWYHARRMAGREDLEWRHLRNTALTLAARAGATVKELMVRAGHSEPRIAIRYQAAAEQRDRELAEKLSKLAKR